MNPHGNNIIPPQDLDGYWVESLDINDIHLHRSIALQSREIDASLALIKKAEIYDLSQGLQEDLKKLVQTFEKHASTVSLESLPELKTPQTLLLKDIQSRYDRLQVNLQLFEHHLKNRLQDEEGKTEEEIMNINRKKIQLVQSESHERIDIMKYFARADTIGTREVQEFIRDTIKRSQNYQGVLMEIAKRYSSDTVEKSESVPINVPDEDEVLKMIESLFRGETANEMRRLHKDIQPSAVSQLLF